METGLTGKTVLITDGGSAAARAMIRAFAAEGANLIVGRSRTFGQSSAIVRESEVAGVRVVTGDWDVRDEASIQFMLEQSVAQVSTIDVLINNTEVESSGKSFADITYAEWENVIDTGLGGALFVTKAVLPGMIDKQWGRVINFTGLAAFFGSDCARTTTQLGIVGLTRGISRWYGKDNVTANCIGPGGITPEAGGSSTEFAPQPTDPVPRWGTPHEVASLAVYLSSNDAAYITGQCILVNGGKFLL
jgi:3-oxoacyl-[acyl-carrier protein] reductase